MKLVDITANLPGYFLTKNTWQSQGIVYCCEDAIREVTAWCAQRPHKKVKCFGVKLNADGSDLEIDIAGYTDKLMPGQLCEAMDEERVLASLRAGRKHSEARRYQEDMAETHADAFIAALAAAGFPDAHETYKGVMVPRSTVVAWAEEHGLGLPANGEEV